MTDCITIASWMLAVVGVVFFGSGACIGIYFLRDYIISFFKNHILHIFMIAGFIAFVFLLVLYANAVIAAMPCITIIP